jgi:hypothetical protein
VEKLMSWKVICFVVLKQRKISAESSLKWGEILILILGELKDAYKLSTELGLG